MKKLIGLGVLLLAACSPKVEVSSPAPAPGASGGIGGATPADAVAMFMTAAKTEDLQAVGTVWGDAQGLTREKITRQEFEMRSYYIVKCLRHDRYSILSEGNAAGGRRVVAAQVTKGSLTKSTSFTLARGPQGRWLVENLELEPLTQICQLG